MRIWTTTVCLVLAVGLLASCAESDRVYQSSPAASPTPSADVRAGLNCLGQPVDLTRFDSLPRASELEPSAQMALRSPRLFGLDDLSEWRVLERTRPEPDHESLTVGRKIAGADAKAPGPYGGRPNFETHSMVSRYSGGDGAHGWWYAYSTNCELRRTFGDLATAEVWLDPDHPAPKPGDTVVHLRVSEIACSGGEPAGDRVKIAELERSDGELRIAIGIEPQAGAFTCPGNPAEPFTIDLDEPLGDQKVLDSAVYPPRPFATYVEAELLNSPSSVP